MIAISWIFDLSAHGVSTLGPVPSGLPHFGFPQGVSWNDVGGLLATSASLFLVILAQSAATSRAYAVKYRERFVENDDLRRPECGEPRRRLQQHLRRERQPDEDRDGRRGRRATRRSRS